MKEWGSSLTLNLHFWMRTMFMDTANSAHDRFPTQKWHFLFPAAHLFWWSAQKPPSGTNLTHTSTMWNSTEANSQTRAFPGNAAAYYIISGRPSPNLWEPEVLLHMWRKVCAAIGVRPGSRRGSGNWATLPHSHPVSLSWVNGMGAQQNWFGLILFDVWGSTTELPAS